MRRGQVISSNPQLELYLKQDDLTYKFPLHPGTLFLYSLHFVIDLLLLVWNVLSYSLVQFISISASLTASHNAVALAPCGLIFPIAAICMYMACSCTATMFFVSIAVVIALSMILVHYLLRYLHKLQLDCMVLMAFYITTIKKLQIASFGHTIQYPMSIMFKYEEVTSFSAPQMRRNLQLHVTALATRLSVPHLAPSIECDTLLHCTRQLLQDVLPSRVNELMSRCISRNSTATPSLRILCARLRKGDILTFQNDVVPSLSRLLGSMQDAISLLATVVMLPLQIFLVLLSLYLFHSQLTQQECFPIAPTLTECNSSLENIELFDTLRRTHLSIQSARANIETAYLRIHLLESRFLDLYRSVITSPNNAHSSQAAAALVLMLNMCTKNDEGVVGNSCWDVVSNNVRMLLRNLGDETSVVLGSELVSVVPPMKEVSPPLVPETVDAKGDQPLYESLEGALSPPSGDKVMDSSNIISIYAATTSSALHKEECKIHPTASLRVAASVFTELQHQLDVIRSRQEYVHRMKTVCDDDTIVVHNMSPSEIEELNTPSRNNEKFNETSVPAAEMPFKLQSNVRHELLSVLSNVNKSASYVLGDSDDDT